MMKRFWFGKVAVMIIFFFAVVSAIVMALWNWLMPELFGLPAITYWEAAGLLLLSKIIFGFGRGGKPRHHHHGPPWKHKWHNMSEDQREKLKRKFADKWCSREESDEKQTEEKKEAE